MVLDATNLDSTPPVYILTLCVFPCCSHDAGISTAERVAAFDQEALELIGEYNRFEIEQYGYEFPG